MRAILAATVAVLMTCATDSVAQDYDLGEPDDIDIPNWWATLPPGGVLAAAWCFDKWGRTNNAIHRKSMRPPSLCPYYIQKNAVVAAIKERTLAEFAVASVCSPVSLEFAGISFNVLSASDALETCQCHNPQAIEWIRRDWDKVEKALKHWGRCN